jgi:hypothetical protein
MMGLPAIHLTGLALTGGLLALHLRQSPQEI